MNLPPAVVVSGTLLFAAWQLALFAAAVVLARLAGFGPFRRTEEQILAILAIELTLESSFAAAFSFLGINSPLAYWIAAAACVAMAMGTRAGRAILWSFSRSLARLEVLRYPRAGGLAAALFVPLLFLSFRPVEEIDSINYLHYLIEWMANRATPYVFATNYVAFWELSFLPAWTITRLDLFFPLLALKGVILLALAAWLAGRELGLRRGLLLWSVLAAVALRHLWFESSGVPTLKNDALHGAGFILLAVVVMRSSRRRLDRADAALLAFGCAFAAVKYTGIFAAALAIAIVIFQRRAWRPAAIAGLFTLLTSGHYYLRNLWQYGSPFYPFQINLGPIHLPGTADLSATSILYSLRDPRVWRLLFLPEDGVSPAGLLFPVTLAVALLVGVWVLVRPPSRACRYGALFLLVGWLLFFRSVYSASAYPGDLVFLRSSLNTIRYVDGVLAFTELFLISLVARWPRVAGALIAANLLSRLFILYAKLPASVFPARIVAAVALSVLLATLATAAWMRRYAIVTVAAAAVCLLLASPILVQYNRVLWTAYWNGLKPSMKAVRAGGLAHLALPEAGYFAGHVVTAGNPVDPRVRSLLPQEIAAMPAGSRPRYLAVLPTPGSAWSAQPLGEWGYECISKAISVGLYEITVK